jgi:S-adenosylmethionine hydrolase
MSGNGLERVAFLTDYGYEDAFAGICRAVVTAGAPEVEMIDLTHGIALGDVRRGAFVLESAVDHLGAAVILAVVDPGVGGDRRAVALRAGGSLFVGPDNGLLIGAAERIGGVDDAVDISKGPFVSGTRSHTFHGRDIFAPAAAALARGETLASAGDPIDSTDLVRLDLPTSSVGADGIVTHVLVEDGFGNLSLGLKAGGPGALPFRPGEVLRVKPRGGEPFEAPFATTFGSVPAGSPVVFVDSTDRLALAVNLGSALDRLGLERDQELLISSTGQTSG